MEGKTNFSRRLKQFDGLTRLTLSPMIMPQPLAYFTTDLRHWQLDRCCRGKRSQLGIDGDELVEGAV